MIYFLSGIFYLAYVILVYIFRMYSGLWTRALRSHAVAQFGWTGTDELSQCNTGSVPLPPGEYGPLSGCGLKNSTHNTCSILLESPGKKKPHSLSRDLFKFLQDHMRFSSFVTTCLAVLAFYPNSGNGRTRRPDITILHLRIHIVLLWLKTSTAYFFLIKTVSTTHPPLFHYPLFYAIPSKYFIHVHSNFRLLSSSFFLTNLIYLITGNKKRKKYVVSLLHCGGVRYRVMIRRSSASPYV